MNIAVFINLGMLGLTRGQGSGPSSSGSRKQQQDVYTTDKDLLNLVNMIVMSGILEDA